jgi:hypothetical protein
MWGYGLDRAGSGYGQVAGICECGNEPSGSITFEEFIIIIIVVVVVVVDVYCS